MVRPESIKSEAQINQRHQGKSSTLDQGDMQWIYSW